MLNALRGAIGEAVAHSTPFREAALDPQLVHLLAELGVLVYLAALVVGAVMIAASSVLTLRTGALSAWLGPVGALISLVVLVGAFIVPSAAVYLLLFWVLATSVSMTLPPHTPPRAEAMAAEYVSSMSGT